MVLIFISLIVLISIGFFLTKKFANYDHDINFFIGCIGIMFLLVGGVGLMIFSCLVYSWIGSDYKAKIINREYGTNYTQEEIFYANDVINVIHEIKRQRVEINGDLLKKEAK